MTLEGVHYRFYRRDPIHGCADAHDFVHFAPVQRCSRTTQTLNSLIYLPFLTELAGSRFDCSAVCEKDMVYLASMMVLHTAEGSESIPFTSIPPLGMPSQTVKTISEGGVDSNTLEQVKMCRWNGCNPRVS